MGYDCGRSDAAPKHVQTAFRLDRRSRRRNRDSQLDTWRFRGPVPHLSIHERVGSVQPRYLEPRIGTTSIHCRRWCQSRVYGQGCRESNIGVRFVLESEPWHHCDSTMSLSMKRYLLTVMCAAPLLAVKGGPFQNLGFDDA